MAARIQYDPEDLKTLAKLYSDEDEIRLEIINLTRTALKDAKNAVYAVHRNDFDEAKRRLKNSETTLREKVLPKTTTSYFRNMGCVTAAIEEYVEAHVFLQFCETKVIPPFSLVIFDFASVEEYVGGLLDFMGELNRYCVRQATQRREAEVACCGVLAEAVMQHMEDFNFRNSQLRRKFDCLKYTVKKIEALVYEMSLLAELKVRPQSTMLQGEEEAGNMERHEADDIVDKKQFYE